MKTLKLNNKNKMVLLAVLAVILIVVYMLVNLNFEILDFSLSIRSPKLIGIILCAFCIGFGSLIFQSIIKNRIVTPCLLGMNSLYVLIHTCLAFLFGMDSIVFVNQNLIFLIDVLIMALIGTIIYGSLFRLTKSNVLYVLLVGTVLSTLFTSISNTMTRVMDPNLYDSLLTTLVAGFDQINIDLILMATVLIVITLVYFRKDIKLLDVMTLGKDQAINLGVNYDRTIKRLLIATTFFITIATSLVGPISFLGLIVTNITREVFKTYRHSYLLIGCFLVGIIVLLGGQTVIEHVMNYGAQISVLVSLFGGGYFLYLIHKNKGLQ